MPKGVYEHLHIKPKVYPEALVAQVRDLYERERTQAEIAAELQLTQKVVWRLMRNHGMTARTAAKRNQQGAENSSWKGEEATYAAFHKRVEVSRGKPAKCSSCDTTEAEHFEWANLTGHYHDVNDYIRLCIPCHRRFDARRRIELGRRTSPTRGSGVDA